MKSNKKQSDRNKSSKTNFGIDEIELDFRNQIKENNSDRFFGFKIDYTSGVRLSDIDLGNHILEGSRIPAISDYINPETGQMAWGKTNDLQDITKSDMSEVRLSEIGFGSHVLEDSSILLSISDTIYPEMDGKIFGDLIEQQGSISKEISKERLSEIEFGSPVFEDLKMTRIPDSIYPEADKMTWHETIDHLGIIRADMSEVWLLGSLVLEDTRMLSNPDRIYPGTDELILGEFIEKQGIVSTAPSDIRTWDLNLGNDVFDDPRMLTISDSIYPEMGEMCWGETIDQQCFINADISKLNLNGIDFGKDILDETELIINKDGTYFNSYDESLENIDELPLWVQNHIRNIDCSSYEITKTYYRDGTVYNINLITIIYTGDVSGNHNHIGNNIKIN